MIRFAFYILIGGHALMHLVTLASVWNLFGIGKFRLTTASQLSTIILAVTSIFWLLTFILFLSALIAHARKKSAWWKLGATALLFSQSLIIIYWADARAGTLANIILLIPVLLSYCDNKFTNNVRKNVMALMADQTTDDSDTVTNDSLENLPPVVQRWLMRSNVIGKKRPKAVYLRQTGWLRTKKEWKWMRMEANQFITTERPGFVWQAVIRAGRMFTINGYDQYRNGKGSMLIKALNVLTLAKDDGEQIDQGAMMRFLAEIMWFPTAALNSYIRWEYINDRQARAVMQYENVTASGVFSFNDEGDVTGFEGKRYANFNHVYSLELWCITVTGYREFHGIRIANKSQVTWKLKEGDFTWLHVEVTDIDYNDHNIWSKLQ
jgi:hypothetical protein